MTTAKMELAVFFGKTFEEIMLTHDTSCFSSHSAKRKSVNSKVITSSEEVKICSKFEKKNSNKLKLAAKITSKFGCSEQESEKHSAKKGKIN